ncbi:lipopolysaccharide assembly protein LapA domain-containing protein [Lapidilactobacillus wuchangensis]|uniref:lipopolysaccharide assembly protein LapA domain-containing protein n=1 Tax=Lapidilactobacillus wuchangensis TaxID=2486001 RepID=UPI001CDC1AAE|nr:lipopolysaccharide assembly protein LapA domain-containing protein [Lapidilactobacillus wuchangensis]
MKKQTRFILVLVLALVVVVFALLNVAPTIISFGFTKVKLPLIVVLLLTLILGALIALLLSTSSSFSAKKQKKALDQELKALKQNQQAEIDQAVATARETIEQQLVEKDTEISDLKARLMVAEEPKPTTTTVETPTDSSTSDQN